MKKFFAALAIFFLSASFSFAFDTGIWKGQKGDINGEIKISRKGSNYIADINIFKFNPSRSNNKGYCLHSAKTREVNEYLQVMHKGRVGFTIQGDGRNIKVIQARNVSLPVCGDHPAWSVNDIARIKWRKVK